MELNTASMTRQLFGLRIHGGIQHSWNLFVACTHPRRGTGARPLARLRSLPLERGRAATGPVPGTALKTRWRRPAKQFSTGTCMDFPGRRPRIPGHTRQLFVARSISTASTIAHAFHSLGASPGQARS